jgi:predicted transposase/invertase (TIGR01784 family)
MKLSEPERIAYERYMENKSYQASMYQSTYVTGHLKGRLVGKEEGRKEGRKEGKKEGKIEMAILMKKEGEPVDKIMKYTQLSRQEIESL